ncbi:MAG: DsbA family protein [Candidatus Peribacteraceae bacterium]|nr:DsbA family protein [Candidatus Peribacteraceae bacterium]MDP7454162.1 DsbA family protein [Candidatus Peribacteraceae bacterium]MDP7646326.1 DsbA family protein [Candidatus Peribacteraceae bacterium]|tara:strand:+ start:1056 stop:1634 length:579 start_codon:yes stop_codon:yes gene_type:complete
MKHIHLVLALSIFLSACSNGGISKESSRPPAGNPDGVILVQEFSDLQCPACRVAHAKVSTPLLQQYGNVIRFEWKHFPLQSHRYAMAAAQASECAADQGKFWVYIDKIFEHQSELSPDSLIAWAGELKLDMELFERCSKSNAKKGIALSDYKEGRDMGVGGTPTFFVDGKQVPTNQLGLIIEQRIEQLKQRL